MKKIVTLMMAAAVSMGMLAVPAKKEWQEKTQPDGTTIKVMLVGDEYYHYWINEAGEQVNTDSDGYWQVVGEAPSTGERAARRNSSPKMSSKPRRVGSINMAPRGLFILVNFSDKSFNASNTQKAMNDMMNAESYTYNGAVGSARQYFIDQSNGAYTPTFDVVGPVTLTKKCSYYGSNDTNGDDKYPGDMIVEACQLADSKFGVDFTKYDNDKDGYVDFVYVIYAGMGEADGGNANTIWPHNWEIESARQYGSCTYTKAQSKVDGKYINNYACSGELNGDDSRSGIGTLCHEFSHVLGLPDYYDTEYGTNYEKSLTPGDWDIMDSGSYNKDGNCPPNYSAWEKYFFGWATPRCLKDKGDYTLTTDYGDSYQLNSASTLAAWSSTATQYYIENRQQTGWDTYLPGHGMLIWKVTYNKSAWEDNEPNNTANKPKYVVVSASGSTSMKGGADPFPGTKNVTSKTLITGKPIKNIVESNGQIKFTYIEAATSYTYYIVAEHATVSSEEGTVAKGQTFSVTITPEADYTIGATELDVQMGGAKLAMGTGYSYNNNVLSISNVSGNIEIIVEPKKVETFTFVSTYNAAWVDNSSSLGWFQIITRGEPKFAASISTLKSPRTMGEFAMTDLDTEYTYIKVWNQAEELIAINPADMKAVMSTDSEGIITGTLTIVEKETGNTYIAIIKHDPSLPVPINYDENTDVEVAFTTDEIVGTEVEDSSVKEILFEAVKEDVSYQLSLVFFANDTDADIVVPAGEYTFAKSEAAGTVLISSGVVNNSVTYSFLATRDGDYLDNIWLPIMGKVTVEKVTINGKKEIYMVLDATNSLGATVKATVGSKPLPTAIQEVVEPSRAVKTLENGQLLIHCEGKTYNAVGVKLADK